MNYSDEYCDSREEEKVDGGSLPVKTGIITSVIIKKGRGRESSGSDDESAAIERLEKQLREKEHYILELQMRLLNMARAMARIENAAGKRHEELQSQIRGLWRP